MTSYRNTALAFATFNESTPFRIGIAAARSHVPRTRSDNPSPSLPKTMQQSFRNPASTRAVDPPG